MCELCQILFALLLHCTVGAYNTVIHIEKYLIGVTKTTGLATDHMTFILTAEPSITVNPVNK